ncbi:Glyoxalase/Bleomycin resistance protein/Dioxygenase superfamily protein [Streptomyces sp. AmelKG-E11A]|uniref:VOC family protein n=1 Tax=Streptomyces sp. SID4919 TaxID=2690270 RepID=UPI0008239B5E|nr:VOC family protein [Streptomyces sp. SID4919]SCK10066.1 Glyoxalase/Bleomycin resistance protein/Dioxygenase superfamily protein [Streptomyces sp. AmelKG-E11A]
MSLTETTARTTVPEPPARIIRPVVDHVGVQTDDLENSLDWYVEFFGARRMWELDRFSPLTLSRLPGIGRLVEVAVGDLRFHLFDRAGHTRAVPEARGYQFQHVCLRVDGPGDLEVFRDRWNELYDSGRFVFARDERPTDIVVDDEGVLSLYVLDVNGLEYEFTHAPDGNRPEAGR